MLKQINILSNNIFKPENSIVILKKRKTFWKTDYKNTYNTITFFSSLNTNKDNRKIKTKKIIKTKKFIIIERKKQ